MERTWIPEGVRETCPIAFKASELRSWEDIIRRFGGQCVYWLRAQNGVNFQWQGSSEKKEFPCGPPRKPFFEEPPKMPPTWSPASSTAPTGEPHAAPAPVAAAPTAPPGYLPPGYLPPGYPPPTAAPDVLGMIIKGMADRETMMLRLMMDRNQAQPNHGASALELFRELRPMMDGGSNGAAMLVQGLELAKSVYQTQAQAPAAAAAVPQDDFAATLGAIVRAMAPQQAAAPPAAPTPTAPPSAAYPPLPPGYAWAPNPAGGWMPVAYAPAAPAAPAAMTLPTSAPASPPASAPASPPASSPQIPAGLDVDRAIELAAQSPSLRAKMRAALDAAERDGSGDLGGFDFGALLADPDVRQAIPPDQHQAMIDAVRSTQINGTSPPSPPHTGRA